MTERTNPSDLIHREIDGESSPADSAELRGRIAEDPGLRAEHARLTTLTRSLDAIGQEEPPAGFVADVMRAIRLGATLRPSWIETWRSAFARRPVLAPALSLAAGIVVGALAVGLVGPSRLMTRDDSAAGTILPAERLDSLLQVDRQELAADGLRGETIMQRRDGELLAELRLESQKTLQVDWEFDPGALTPLAFERGAPALGAVTLEPNRVRITQAGSGKYRLVFGLKGHARTAIRLTLMGEGILLERKLETGGE